MMATTSMRKKPPRITITLDLPPLDDAAAITIYNLLCELADQFDLHYGEQICRFYAQNDAMAAGQTSAAGTDDPPF